MIGNVTVANSVPTPTPSPPSSPPPSRPGTAIVADFNRDGVDWVVRNATTRQTTIWYLNNNVFVTALFGFTIPVGWSSIGQ
jgi:hypothetical protein